MNEYLRKCTKCGLEAKDEKDLILFSTNKQCKFGKQNLCKICRGDIVRDSYVKKNPNAKKYNSIRGRRGKIEGGRSAFDKKIYNKFGITEDEFNVMLSSQNHSCAICDCKADNNRNGGYSRFAIDHCHESGKVRGLLCMKCNTGIGMLDDNKGYLEKAIIYLD